MHTYFSVRFVVTNLDQSGVLQLGQSVDVFPVGILGDEAAVWKAAAQNLEVGDVNLCDLQGLGKSEKKNIYHNELLKFPNPAGPFTNLDPLDQEISEDYSVSFDEFSSPRVVKGSVGKYILIN